MTTPTPTYRVMVKGSSKHHLATEPTASLTLCARLSGGPVTHPILPTKPICHMCSLTARRQ